MKALQSDRKVAKVLKPLPWLKLVTIFLGVNLFMKVMLTLGIGALPQTIMVGIGCYVYWRKGKKQRKLEQS